MSTELHVSIQEVVDAYIAAHKREVFFALLLAVVLGPVGALYGTWVGGCILTLVAGFALAVGMSAPSVTGVQMAMAVVGLSWVLALIVGPLGAHDHNRRIKTDAALRLLHGGMAK